MVDINNELNVHHCKTIQELKEAFMMYDVHRQCFIYKNLVFVNSTLGGGWEAWTLKKFGDELIAFESISMQHIIKEGTHDRLTFEEYITQLLTLTKQDVLHYLDSDYWKLKGDFAQLLSAEIHDSVDTSLSTLKFRDKRIGEITVEAEKLGFDVEEWQKKVEGE